MTALCERPKDFHLSNRCYGILKSKLIPTDIIISKDVKKKNEQTEQTKASTLGHNTPINIISNSHGFLKGKQKTK